MRPLSPEPLWFSSGALGRGEGQTLLFPKTLAYFFDSGSSGLDISRAGVRRGGTAAAEQASVEDGRVIEGGAEAGPPHLSVKQGARLGFRMSRQWQAMLDSHDTG